MKVSVKAVAGCAAFVLSGFALGCATTGGSESPAGAAAEAAATGPKSYTCFGGKTIRVEGAKGEPQLRLTLPEGRDAKLAAVDGAKGNSYSDGSVTLTFESEGVNVKFSSGREPLTGCVAPR